MDPFSRRCGFQKLESPLGCPRRRVIIYICGPNAGARSLEIIIGLKISRGYLPRVKLKVNSINDTYSQRFRSTVRDSTHAVE